MDFQPGQPLYKLAETKFVPPLLREDVIPRMRLLSTLSSMLASKPLTLISAPAGYGKTTLLASLATFHPVINLAWLSLDEEDNDSARFLTAFISSLQLKNPGFGETAYSLLGNPIHFSSDIRRVASVLINDMLETLSQPFAVILDDLHHINQPSIYTALDYLLEHPPPQMHIVVASRVDPPLALSRLRARGELAELRLSELRFSDDEASSFLNDRMQLNLLDDELQLLQSRAEGWAVGLRLLGTSLTEIDTVYDRSIFIDHLARSDRYIYDFLAEEVFNHQDPDIKAFLLESSILPELTPALCQSVTGRKDAGAVLENLYRRNLFLVQISTLQDGSNALFQDSPPDQVHLIDRDSHIVTKYRYHDLFAEFLRRRLEQTWPDRIPELHLLAARAESDPARAIAHYLAAASWQEAADLIEQLGAEMFNRGYLDTLSRWISALPTAVRECRPRLLHYLSHCAFINGAWLDVQPLLERALLGFAEAGDEVGKGVVLADLGVCASAEGDLERARTLYGQALEYPILSHTRVQALLGHALASSSLGDRDQIERDFNAAMATIQQNGGLNHLQLVAFPFFHPSFAFLPGGLAKLETICRQARSQLGDEISPSRLMVEEMDTILHLLRGRLKEAIHLGENALALRVRLGGHPYISLNAALFLLFAYSIRGDYSSVERLFDCLFLGVDQSDQAPPDFPVYLFFAARVRWLQAYTHSSVPVQLDSASLNYLQETRQYYDRMCNLMESDSRFIFPETQICRIWTESLLDIADGRIKNAESSLRQSAVLEQVDRDSAVYGNTRLMLARLYLDLNRRQEALNELAPVLAYYQQLGIPFAILLEGQSIVPLLRLGIEHGIHPAFAAQLLQLMGSINHPGPVRIPQTGEILTPREVEVLQLVILGVNNRTIAERLVITESTVKTHIYHIFAKLDVSNRTQAAARTRQLNLV